MIESSELEGYILLLEKELLKPEVRCSKERVSKLLAKDFIEFCSSGKVYVYEENQIIDATIENEVEQWKISNFKIKKLSEQSILATYILTKVNLKQDRCSLRSSIWQFIDNRWQMSFHQGTIIRD